MINSVVLVGRIGKDPELTYTANGTAIAKMSLAVDRFQKGEEKVTDWFDIVAWGKAAEFAGNYLQKGALVGIEGRLQANTWETKEGQKRKSVEVHAHRVQGLVKAAAQEESAAGPFDDQ